MTAVRPVASRPLAEEDLDFVLDRSETLWSDVRGGRLFLTGGTGFFGLWLLESFLHVDARLGLGAHVTVLARNRERFAYRAPHLAEDSRVTFLQGDVRTFDLSGGKFSHVIHAATDSTLPATAEYADATVDTIVNGTRRVLRFARECGARKLLFVSSGAVYGPPPSDLPLDEAYHGAPALDAAIAPYAEGKRVAEMLVTRETAFDATLARAFAFVGPHLPLDAHFAVGNFLRNALAGEPIQIKGDPNTVRAYLYAADLALWLWTILFRGTAGRAYNVGSEHAITLRELAETVVAATGADVPIRTALLPAVSPTPSHYVPSTARARTELGLEEGFSLSEALRRTANYHRLSPSPIYP